MSATKQDIENLQINMINMGNNLQTNQVNNFNNIQSNLDNVNKQVINNKDTLNTHFELVSKNITDINNLQTDVDAVGLDVEELFNRLYGTNGPDPNDTVSGVYTAYFFIDQPSVFIKNVIESKNQNKDIYDFYTIKNRSKTFNLRTRFELLTDENGVKSFTLFGAYPFVFINENTAISTTSQYFFKKIASPNLEIGKFLDQVRNIYLSDTVLTNLQINSDLPVSEKWNETLKILNGLNVLETVSEDILTGEQQVTNEKKLTRTDLLELADKLYYSDEFIEYGLEIIKPTVTFDECEGRLIQCGLNLSGEYLDILTLNNYSKVILQDVTITGSSDDALYQDFEYRVSGFDRCSSQQYKQLQTSNRVQLCAPIYTSGGNITLTFIPEQDEQIGINDTVTITIPRGLYYTDDLTNLVNNRIKKVTNYSVRMDLIANSNILYGDQLNLDNISNSNLRFYIMSQTVSKGIELAKSVNVSNITGDIGSILGISQGVYDFGEVQDSRIYTRSIIVESGVKLNDNPPLFTSIYGVTFTSVPSSKIIHVRSKVSGSGDPRVYFDNLFIYTANHKIEHHNLLIQKMPPSGFGELFMVKTWYDFNLIITREHIPNESGFSINGPTDGEFLSTTYRGNPVDTTGRFAGFYQYFGGGIAINGQSSVKSINGLIGAAKTSTVYENDLNSFIKNYLEEAKRFRYDAEGNAIFQDVLNYVEDSETTAPIVAGSYCGIFKNDKLPPELQGEVVGIWSQSSSLLNLDSKLVYETVIDYFNSKNVTKVILDYGTNPGGNTQVYASLIPGELKTNYSQFYMPGYSATNTSGKKYKYQFITGLVDWYDSLDSTTKETLDPYLLALYNLRLSESWVNENNVRFQKFPSLEKELNNVTSVVQFLNVRSYSANQSAAAVAKSIRLNNTIPFTHKVIGRINKVFGTGGGNFPNVTGNTGTFENIEADPDVRNEAVGYYYGEDRKESDDYVTYYNTFDNTLTYTDGSYEEYLQDIGLLPGKGVDFTDSTTYICHEMEYCLSQLI